MGERCCDEIIQVSSDLTALDKRVKVLEDTVPAQLQAINDKLTTWVNPVLALVISVLCTMLGASIAVMAVMHQ